MKIHENRWKSMKIYYCRVFAQGWAPGSWVSWVCRKGRAAVGRPSRRCRRRSIPKRTWVNSVLILMLIPRLLSKEWRTSLVVTPRWLLPTTTKMEHRCISEPQQTVRIPGERHRRVRRLTLSYTTIRDIPDIPLGCNILYDNCRYSSRISYGFSLISIDFHGFVAKWVLTVAGWRVSLFCFLSQSQKTATR